MTVASALGSSGAVSAAMRRPAQIGDVVANEIADAGLDFGHGGEIVVAFLGCFNFFGTNGRVHRLFLCFAFNERGRPPHDEVMQCICASDFDRIWANLRQCSIILGGGTFWPENAPNRGDSGLTSYA